MNYLAHLLLAGDDPEERLGGIIADFTRGRLETLAACYPPGVMRGISMHRKIDQFTDRHSLIAHSKSRFSAQRRRYAGIIIDVLFDHFLRRHRDRYSNANKHEFIDSAYCLLEKNHDRLPARMQRVAPLMIDQDWLGSYHHIECIGEAYDRMAQRLRSPNSLSGAVDEVQALYPLLEQDFELFFPQLQSYVSELSRNPPVLMYI